jgi:hypothetical protein
MNKNVKVAKELVKLAKSLIAFDDDGIIAKELTERVDKIAEMFEASLGERAEALKEAYAKVIDLEKEFKDAFK